MSEITLPLTYQKALRSTLRNNEVEVGGANLVGCWENKKL